jgi:hypothetical protein
MAYRDKTQGIGWIFPRQVDYIKPLLDIQRENHSTINNIEENLNKLYSLRNELNCLLKGIKKYKATSNRYKKRRRLNAKT